MRVRVDPQICQGHTLCALAAPDVFGFDEDDGHAYVRSEVVDDGHTEAVRRAAATCPEGAIFVEG
ncbi:MAG TPA: ferredoxin [Acidimicrobiales bacterium]|nr:ferredoxin [Acidimicrobiales bacterium]